MTRTAELAAQPAAGSHNAPRGGRGRCGRGKWAGRWAGPPALHPFPPDPGALPGGAAPPAPPPQPSVGGRLDRFGSNRQSSVKRRHIPCRSWESQACRCSARDRLKARVRLKEEREGLPVTKGCVGTLVSQQAEFQPEDPQPGRVSSGMTGATSLSASVTGFARTRPSGSFRSSLWVQVKILQLAGWLSGQKSPANAGDAGSIPGPGGCLGGRKGNPLQYFCLEDSMDRGSWWTAVHGAAEESDRTEHKLLTGIWVLLPAGPKTWLWGRRPGFGGRRN